MTKTVESLKEELEGTRRALRRQTIRCRQLVLAYSTKLKETEVKLRNSEEIRERQLSHLLRVLLILEAKLRKEQKTIRHQLIEKDEVITRQRKEIESLSKSSLCTQCSNSYDCVTQDDKPLEVNDDTSYDSGSHSDDLALGNSKPDLISSITYPSSKSKLKENDKVQNSLTSALHVFDKHIKKSVKFDTSPQQGNPIYYSSDDQSSAIHPSDESTSSHNSSGGSHSGADDTEFQDNPVLKCVNQILLRQKEDYIDEDMESPTLQTVKGSFNRKSKRMEITKSSKALSKSEGEKLNSLDRCLQNQTKPPDHNSKSPPNVPPKPLNLNWLSKKIFPTDQSSKLKTKLAFMKNSFSLDNYSVNGSEEHCSGDELYVISNSALQEVDDDDPDGSNSMDESKVDEKRHNYFHLNSTDLFSKDILPKNMISPSDSKEKSGHSAKVSVMVRKFEDLKSRNSRRSLSSNEDNDNSNELKNNFEEFSFDDCEVDNVDPHEDKNQPNAKVVAAKNTATNAKQDSVTYEKFLEATGLSQKSIITPSRLVNSRKIMMRPKDVKHRSRAKAAATNYIDRCGNSEYMFGSTTKYWTEPFL